MPPACFGAVEEDGQPMHKVRSLPAGGSRAAPSRRRSSREEGPPMRKVRSFRPSRARFWDESELPVYRSEPEAPRTRSADSKASTATSESSDTFEEGSAGFQRMAEADFLSRYHVGDFVSSSAHPGVTLTSAVRISDGLAVVLKAYSKALAFPAGPSEEAKWRRAAASQLHMPKSERLCELLEMFETDKRYYVVMEKVEGQDLEAWQSNSGMQFKHVAVREILRQVLEATEVMHSAGYLHRDLKNENVMVKIDDKVSAKLVDFDTALACKSVVVDTSVVGTHCYNAPETFTGQYSTASDMYSVGCIMYKLLTHRLPVSKQVFDGKMGEQVVGSPCMKRIHRRLASTPIDFSGLDDCPEAAALCKSLLSFQPEKRVTAEEALAHEWFALKGALPELARPARPAAQQKSRIFTFGMGKAR